MSETPRVHRETVGTELVDTSSASLHASVNTGGPKTPTNALYPALISLALNIFHSTRLLCYFCSLLSIKHFQKSWQYN